MNIQMQQTQEVCSKQHTHKHWHVLHTEQQQSVAWDALDGLQQE